MSRIGNAPIQLPSGVDVTVDGQTVTVKGSKGSLTRELVDRVSVDVEDGVVTVSRDGDDREAKSLHGLFRALIANMVTGVSEGFEKRLETVGVGYRASLQGSTLELQVGFSHPVHMQAPDGIDFEVPDQNTIIVRGIDKETVGQVAANIRAVRPPEPYKGKGIRYADEYVRRKAGKAGVAR
ncbi:MAG: 50S ribosomal protein L6 [Acidimicrobiia bacterium]|nr:50S ribosomal protein L6 [Acidimicrobiia bacterium]